MPTDEVLGYSPNPFDAEADAQKRDIRLRAIVRDIRARHASRGVKFPDDEEDYEGAAGALNEAYLPLNEVPSWRNAEELASSPEAKAANSNSWMPNHINAMHPARYAYMQNVGRDQDLLAGLASGARYGALEYWDRSRGANAKSTRDNTLAPSNYWRFNTFQNAATNRLGTIGRALASMENVPNLVLNATGGGTDYGLVPAREALNKRISGPLAENPIGMLPTDGKARGFEDLTKEWGEHTAQNDRLQAALAPPSGHNVAQNIRSNWIQPAVDAVMLPRGFKRDPKADPVHATRFEGDLVGTVISILDPSSLVGIGGALSKTPKVLSGLYRIGKRSAARAAKTAGQVAYRTLGGASGDLTSEAISNPLINASVDSEGYGDPQAWSDYFTKREAAPPLKSADEVRSSINYVTSPDIANRPEMREHIYPTKTPTTRYIPTPGR